MAIVLKKSNCYIITTFFPPPPGINLININYIQASEDYRSVGMKAHTVAHTCVHITFRRASVHLQVKDKV